MSKIKVGRPTVMTPETIAKLEQAFTMDMTDLEACLYTNIAKTQLYDYQNKNPEFKDRKELLKNSLSLKAKAILAKKINDGDAMDAKWWLERRRKREFSLRQEMEISGDGENPIQIKIIDDV